MRNPFGLPKLPIKILLPILIFGVLAISEAAVFDTDIEILQSDRNGVTLRYIVPEPSFDQFDIGTGHFFWMNVPRTAQNSKQGEIQIPSRIIPLAMPVGAHAVIQILDSQYGTIPYKKLAPYFVRFSEAEFLDAYQSAEAENPIIPSSAPYLATSGKLRDLELARIAIPTARYSLNPPQLEMLVSMTVRVNFEGTQAEMSSGYSDPGPFFERIFRKTVANYDIGKDWFILRPSSFARLEGATQIPFDSASTWIRVEIGAEGIYNINWNQLTNAGINPQNIDPTSIRIFYGGGKELPIPNSTPRPNLTEIPIDVTGSEDGQFNGGDQIIFFADAVDSWEYDQTTQRFKHYRNHYTDKNVYWLTYNGTFSGPAKRFTITDGTPGGQIDASVDTYNALFHNEQEIEFSPENYFDWYWRKTSQVDASAQLYDVVSGGLSTVVTKQLNAYPVLSVNDGPGITPQINGNLCVYQTSSLTGALNRLTLRYNVPYWLDYVDIEYPRWLKVIDGSLRFSAPDTSGRIRYNLADVRSPYVLLDISDKSNPVKITGGSVDGTNLIFDDTVSAQSHRQYYISSNDRLKTPRAIAVYQMDNLRDLTSPSNEADEIIITYDGFYDQAVRLAEHRRDTYHMATRVVKISDIYNQFSYGLFDPTAIRDFLKYTYENWPGPIRPTFALLIGDGNYDYRNNLGNNERILIPPFEAPEGYDNSVTDERFIYFGANGRLDSDTNSFPDMVIGRLPADSPQDAEDMVSKIINYDSSPDFGSWRDRIVIAADDNLNAGLHSNSEDYHTTQAETLTNSHIPNRFEVIKLYMVDYLMRANLEKPEAREALISAFNQGALIVDWIGHGSWNLWAHEHIFRRIDDIPRLFNGKKLPLVYTASCDIGMFDIPAIECMGEDFMKNSSRGAIGVISATRAVYAGPNAILNQEVFDALLDPDSISIGMAFYLAKLLNCQGGQTLSNDRYYLLFGDPALYLQFPKYKVRLTSAPDSLVALAVDSLSGEVTDSAGFLQSDFNGRVWVTVKDGTIQRSVVLRDFDNSPLRSSVSFKAPGANIFTGPAEVVNGRFTSRFFIPKDVSYGSHGAKIYAYTENGSMDAVGVKDSLLISGSLPSIQDSIGPAVNLFADGRAFTIGATIVPQNFTLGAVISDEHGINITGQLGHGLVLSIDDGDVSESDITGSFNYDMGNYQSGRLDYKMPSLPLGEHDISLKVWDNFNNSSLVTGRIEIVENQNLELSEVMNYPNPVRGGDGNTSFQYCLNNNVDRVSVKIFTEAGRKIRTIDITDPASLSMGCHQTPGWDLLDADGSRIANGVYLYKVLATKIGLDGKKASDDDIGKLVILR